MKKLLLLLFSILVSFNSFAEWTPVDSNDDVTTFIDFNTIKKHNEFIYWWNMVESESLEGKSGKFYVQGDCGISRTKILTMIAYNESMGKEELERETPDNPKWKYLTPDSVAGFLLDTSCRFIDASDIEQQEILEEIQSKEELQRLLRIEEDKAKANEDLAKELELRLLELEKLVQEKNQQLNKLSELKTEFEKDGLLLSLLELEDAKEKAAVAIKQKELAERQAKIAQQLTQIEVEFKNQLEAEIAAQQQAYEREQYTQLLNQEMQEEQSSELMQVINNQKAILQTAWVNNIAAEVKSVWNFPGAEDGWFVEVLVTQNKEGEVMNVKIGDNNVGSSVIAQRFKDSVERAVYKATPLPIAPDVSVWQKDILFTFYAD
jgi:hypothetical protein